MEGAHPTLTRAKSRLPESVSTIGCWSQDANCIENRAHEARTGSNRCVPFSLFSVELLLIFHPHQSINTFIEQLSVSNSPSQSQWPPASSPQRWPQWPPSLPSRLPAQPSVLLPPATSAVCTPPKLTKRAPFNPKSSTKRPIRHPAG